MYELKALMDFTSKLFEKLELKLPESGSSNGITTPSSPAAAQPGAIFDQLRQCVFIRNEVGAHHNVQGMAVSDSDVQAFGNLVIRLVESVSCPTCRQIPSTREDTYFRCSCRPRSAAQLWPASV